MVCPPLSTHVSRSWALRPDTLTYPNRLRFDCFVSFYLRLTTLCSVLGPPSPNVRAQHKLLFCRIQNYSNSPGALTKISIWSERFHHALLSVIISLSSVLSPTVQFAISCPSAGTIIAQISRRNLCSGRNKTDSSNHRRRPVPLVYGVAGRSKCFSSLRLRSYYNYDGK